MKQLHKFMNKEDLPWVQLLWENYYNNNKIAGARKVGSFWWRDILKLMDLYKGTTSVQIGNGSTVQFWDDSFNGAPFRLQFPELFSFAKDEKILLLQVREHEHFADLINQPLSIQAYHQWEIVNEAVSSIQLPKPMIFGST